MYLQSKTFLKFFFIDPPNIITTFESNIKNQSVILIGNVYFLDNSPDVLETFWTKNNERLNTEESGGKLSEMRIDNPSLTIRNVSPDDAGEYRLTAINAIGSTTSDVIVLGILVIYFVEIILLYFFFANVIACYKHIPNTPKTHSTFIASTGGKIYHYTIVFFTYWSSVDLDK